MPGRWPTAITCEAHRSRQLYCNFRCLILSRTPGPASALRNCIFYFGVLSILTKVWLAKVEASGEILVSAGFARREGYPQSSLFLSLDEIGVCECILMLQCLDCFQLSADRHARENRRMLVSTPPMEYAAWSYLPSHERSPGARFLPRIPQPRHKDSHMFVRAS